MSRKRSAIEKFVEEIIVDLMIERVMFVGIHASLTGVLQASPSTRHRSGCTAEKRSKHHDDLDNVK